MSVNLDLTNSAVDRVRLRLGDFHCPYILDDQTIDYYITKNSGNESQSYKELLTVMLFSLYRDWETALSRKALNPNHFPWRS